MPYLGQVHLMDWLCEFLDEGHAWRCDGDQHRAAVLDGANTFDPSSLLESVEHSGDIGRTRDQTRGQLKGWHGHGVRRLQQPQHVVLLGRQVVLGQQFILESPQSIVRSPQSQVDFLLLRIESFGLGGCVSGWHDRRGVGGKNDVVKVIPKDTRLNN